MEHRLGKTAVCLFILMNYMLGCFLRTRSSVEREKSVNLRDAREAGFTAADKGVSYGVAGSSIPARVGEAGCDLCFTVSPREL